MTDSDVSMEFESGRITIRPAERRLLVDGKPAALGGRAFDLLLVLAERRRRAVSKSELLELVWPGRVVEENNLQVQISTLRRILGPQTIATIPGRGYQFTLGHEGAPAVATAPVPAAVCDPSKGNVPESASTLYGREEDLAALLALLGFHRLVTLIGAGGIGKSTLALAAARAERERWDDGVWLIELAPVADPALIPATVAQALGVQLGGRQAPLDEVVEALSSRTLLLVLDNCEHLLAAVAQFADSVLARSPSVKILATSQEPLHIAAERQIRVPPLALPADVRGANPLDYGALALFEARVQGIDSRFRLDPSNLEAGIEICRRLDCLPLAIELAAARVPLLGLEGVRGRLDDRFRILTSGLRAGLSRHQTLRAAIEWSHSLLTVDERAVFRRLSVFCGSFGLDAAQRVASDTKIDQWAVLDHLGALVDKSLVVVHLGTVPRYHLLETSRALASEKLGEAGETDSTRRAHAQAVLSAFEGAFHDQWRKSEESLLDLHLPDLDNLRTALDWASGLPHEADLLIAIAGASALIWNPTGLRLEGRQRCLQAIERITSTTPAAHEARLQLARARLSMFPSSTVAEVRACERAIELYRALDDRLELSTALAVRARQQIVIGKLEDGENLLREAEELSESDSPQKLQIRLLHTRAFLLISSRRRAEAKLVCEHALRIARASGDSFLVSWALVNSIDSDVATGDVEQAVVRGREILKLCRFERPVHALVTSYGLAMLAAALTQQGELGEALQRAREAAAQMRHAGLLPFFLDHFAMLAFKRGRSADAARALGYTDAFFLGQPASRHATEQGVRDRLLILLQQTLPKDDLAHYMREGAAMSEEDVTRAALGE